MQLNWSEQFSPSSLSIIHHTWHACYCVRAHTGVRLNHMSCMVMGSISKWLTVDECALLLCKYLGILESQTTAQEVFSRLRRHCTVSATQFSYHRKLITKLHYHKCLHVWVLSLHCLYPWNMMFYLVPEVFAKQQMSNYQSFCCHQMPPAACSARWHSAHAPAEQQGIQLLARKSISCEKAVSG